MWINLAFLAAVGPLYGYATDLFYPAKYRALACLVPQSMPATATTRFSPLLGRRLRSFRLSGCPTLISSVLSATPSAPYVYGRCMQRTACHPRIINWCSAL